MGGGPTAAPPFPPLLPPLIPPPDSPLTTWGCSQAQWLSAALGASGGPPTPLNPHRGFWGGVSVLGGGVLQLPPPSPPPRFSPDSLGLQASSALAWLLLEVLAVLLSLYLFSLPTDLSAPDLLAFAGYKYVG